MQKRTLYWKIHNSKIPFLNWLKFLEKIVNYMYFKIAKLLECNEVFWISYVHFTAIFWNFPSVFDRFLQFPGFSLHGNPKPKTQNPILSSNLNFSSNFTSIIVVCIFLNFFFRFSLVVETQNAKIAWKILFWAIWGTTELSAFIKISK